MAECATGDAVYIGTIGQVVGFFERGIDGILSDIAAAILGAAVELFANLGDIPTVGDESLNDSIHLQTDWLVVTIAVASLLAAAFRTALERKGQPLVVALMGLVRMVLTVIAAWWVVNWLASEADAYSQHLYEEGIKAQLKLIANCGTDGLTAFLLIIIGLLLLIAGCIHVILMYIRLGVMVLLTGTLPLAAAASMSEWGGGWWRKHIAWMVAWLAFKPVVGLIMYSGAAMIGATDNVADEDSAKHYKLAGVAVLLMAAVALPALMRLVVPAMASLGSRDGVGAGAGAGAAAAGAVASGAKKIAGGAGSAARSGRSRGPSGGSSSPGGASGGGRSAGGRGGGPSGGSGGGSGGGSSGGSGGGGSDGGSGGGRSRSGQIARGAVGVAAATVGAAASAVQVGARAATSTHKHARNIASGALPDADD
ncbi:hypothetical protein [Micromonospora sp. C95]|uniref:hypothetical protein n=1 Tax=Micromonospora sp. C95 TaxID=2824882 RepID=UPI001B36C554|nr:hypothetical protein [Micromonospora sp. C95]MBQ1027859.1 hypothetical protein [Micromonospora sp. C95]